MITVFLLFLLFICFYPNHATVPLHITGSYVDAHRDMKKAHTLYLENVKSGKRKPAKVLEIDMPKAVTGGGNSTKITGAGTGNSAGVGRGMSSEEEDDASVANLIRAVDSSADSAAEAFAAAVSAYGTARAAHTALVSVQALQGTGEEDSEGSAQGKGDDLRHHL